MAGRGALPLLLPRPLPPKPSFPEPQNLQPHNHPAPPSPINPLLQELLHPPTSKENTNSPQSPKTKLPTVPLSQTRPPTSRKPRLGKSRNNNNHRKPWSARGVSLRGQQCLQTLLNSDAHTHVDQLLDELLLSLTNECDLESLPKDLLGIIKGLAFHKKHQTALGVFEWMRNRKDSEFLSLFSGPLVAVIVSILGIEGRVSAAASLLHSLQKDGFSIDVHAYTSLINAYSINGRHQEAVTTFKKMVQEGWKPTLITYSIILNVYGKMGMPWNELLSLIQAMGYLLIYILITLL